MRREGEVGPPSGVRPRYPRIAAAVGSTAVTLVAVLGASGVLPVSGSSRVSVTHADSGPDSSVDEGSAMVLSAAVPAALPRPSHSTLASGASAHAAPGQTSPGEDADATVEATPSAPKVTELPEGSGAGRRVVFDISDQRVWLVSAPDRVRRTYLVSGSLTDNLGPGTYAVYSRSRHAAGIDDSGTMQFMVRFTHGERAAIGFHDIPVSDGRLVQSRAQLGTPQSHGCIRQRRVDARALWHFAPVGTSVVVTA